jgi:hypothetical protein
MKKIFLMMAFITTAVFAQQGPRFIEIPAKQTPADGQSLYVFTVNMDSGKSVVLSIDDVEIGHFFNGESAEIAVSDGTHVVKAYQKKWNARRGTWVDDGNDRLTDTLNGERFPVAVYSKPKLRGGKPTKLDDAAQAGQPATMAATQQSSQTPIPLPGIELNRTTSTLTVGIPVDVSPYILNAQSIVSVPTNNGWQQLNAIQRQQHLEQQRQSQQRLTATINQGVSVGAITSNTAATLGNLGVAFGAVAAAAAVTGAIIDLVEQVRDYRYYEFDLEVSFEDSSRQQNSFKITGAACEKYKNRAEEILEETLKREVAKMLNLDPYNKKDMRNLKKFRVKILNSREGETKFDAPYGGVFFQEIEPCFYQFDVEVGYQKTRERRNQETTYAVFDKIYRSNLRTLGAAAIDVQYRIWEDAVDQGHRRTPIPTVNFVRALKVLPEQKTLNPVISKLVLPSQDTSQTTTTQTAAMDGYFIQSDGQPLGPNSHADLVLLARQGTLTRNSLVWKEGMAQWARAGDIAELNAVFSAVPPPLPPVER